MWQDTTKGNGGADKGVELLVTANSELQVAGGDSLDLEILGGVLWIPVSQWSKTKCESRNLPPGQLTPASSRTSAVRYSSTAVT